MTAVASEKSLGRTESILREAIWQILPPLAYFIGMLRFFPHWRTFWIYSDEGFNVMKAMLVLRGYSLYSQIWSDQPPLVTQLLAYVYKLNGLSLYASRVLILLFSCLLVWAAVQFMRLAWGNSAALLSIFFLILIPYFLTLSVAVLVGQPSLALAMVSLLCLAAWHRSRKWPILCLSAVALSVSLLAKLFTGFLVPIFAAGLVLAEVAVSQDKKDFWKIIRPALVWSSVLILFTLSVGVVLIYPGNVLQLIRPHLEVTQLPRSPDGQDFPITFYLRDSWSILLLSLVGIAYAIRQRRWMMLYPLAWMATTLVILLNLHPVWFHHTLLVTIPAALLAAGAVAETLRLIQQAIRSPKALGRHWIWLAVGAAAIILVLATRPIQAVNGMNVPGYTPGERRAPFEERLMRKINQYSAQTHWMVTDLPMFAFQAGIPVPPNLAVISGKRLMAGELTEEEIVETVRSYRPEQVLISRFEFPQLDQYLEEDYMPVLERDSETVLYVRKDLLK